MIAQIDPMWNIEAYVYQDDLSNLGAYKKVKGILVRQADKSQRGELELSMNKSTIIKSTQRDFYLERDFKASIQLPTQICREIIENSMTEYNHNLVGLAGDGKIIIYNFEKLEGIEKYFAKCLKSDIENITI